MCLSFLTNRYLRFSFFGEYVQLRPGPDRLFSQETYDVFFTPATDWPNARLLCMSPHSLVGEDGRLGASVVHAPGAGAEVDEVYKIGAGHDFSYDARKRVFSVVLAKSEPNSVGSETYAGEVVPSAIIGLPDSIAHDPAVLDVMSQAGTLFELRLGNLTRGRKVAFRLVVEPAVIHTEPAARDPEDEESDEPRGLWHQYLSIICPKTCNFNFRKLLARARGFPDCAEAAALLQAILSEHPHIIPAQRTRLVVIGPPRATMDRSTPPGAVWAVGQYTLAGHRVAAEWAGGATPYSLDDVGQVARYIVQYVREWAGGDPKTKEAMTTALGLTHGNTSVIVDALAARRVLVVADNERGTYRVGDFSPEEEELAIQAISWDPDVTSRFSWVGYELQFGVSYLNPSEADLKKARRSKARRWLGFWLALASIIAGMAGLIVAIVALVISLSGC